MNTLGAQVGLTGTNVVANSTLVAVAWNASGFNDLGIWSSSTNPSRLTVPTAFSRIQVVTNISWGSEPVGLREVRIVKNGATDVSFGGSIVDATANLSGFSGQPVATVVLPVVPGDYFEVYVEQTSGGSLNMNNTGCYASMTLLG